MPEEFDYAEEHVNETTSISLPKFPSEMMLCDFYNGPFKELFLAGFKVYSVEFLKGMTKFNFKRWNKVNPPDAVQDQ